MLKTTIFFLKILKMRKMNKCISNAKNVSRPIFCRETQALALICWEKNNNEVIIAFYDGILRTKGIPTRSYL